MDGVPAGNAEESSEPAATLAGRYLKFNAGGLPAIAKSSTKTSPKISFLIYDLSNRSSNTAVSAKLFRIFKKFYSQSWIDDLGRKKELKGKHSLQKCSK